MKVLYIVSSLKRSGPILVLQNIIRNLDIPKENIFIVKLLSDDPQKSITHEFIEDGVEVVEMNSTKLNVELHPIKCARLLEKTLKEISPDIIHVHGYQGALVASKLKQTIPLTITLHNVPQEDFIYSKGKLMGHYMLWRFKKALKKFTSAVAISETVRNAHYRLLGHALPIEMIYNGVSLPKFDIHRADFVKRKYKIEDNDKIFVVVGHLSVLKDPLCIIKAFKHAFKSNKDVKLFFLGTGALLQECINEKGDDERIFFIGYTPDVTTYLGIANYMISASHSEGFGLNVVESLSMGTPVIMTNIEVFNEFRGLYPSLKSLTFKCGDIGSLSEIFAKVYEMGEQAFNGIKDDVNVRFSSREMGDKYLNYYRRIILA